MPIEYLRIKSVGPFDDVEFEFDKQVNVFVGPNNCGKSVTLMVLGEIAVFPFGMPPKYYRQENPSYTTKIRLGKHLHETTGILPITADAADNWEFHLKLLKEIGYTTFIPALRRSTDYRGKGPGPRKKEEDVYEESHGFMTVKKSGRPLEPWEKDPEIQKRQSLIQTEASLVQDVAVIQKMIDLDYMAYRRDDKSIRKIVEYIAVIASDITDGFPIKFSGIGEDDNGLFPEFKTPDGKLPFNCLSQGTQSIMQWLAHLVIGYAEYYNYPKDLAKKRGVLIIDEIDAHLHPSWQRRIIPCLTEHFPKLQIFFSTHSPLMLAGLRAGQVHLLRRKKKGVVSITQNEKDIVGWSGDEILRSLMDIDTPTDLQTAEKINNLYRLRRLKRLSDQQKKELNQLKLQIGEDLLGGPVEAQIEELKRLLEKQKRKK